MKILIVSEGIHELEGALANLVERLTGGSHTFDTRFFKDIPTAKLHGKGPRLRKRAVQWMRQAEDESFDAIVVIIDEDGKKDRCDQFEQAQNEGEVSIARALGVAVQKFDAWMLADEKALSKVLGANVDRQQNPEDIREPKEVCKGLRNSHQLDCSLRDFYHRIAENADLDIVKERCPRGFQPFAERVGTLNSKRSC
jgi:Domain of unknown function (DUF4276)